MVLQCEQCSTSPILGQIARSAVPLGPLDCIGIYQDPMQMMLGLNDANDDRDASLYGVGRMFTSPVNAKPLSQFDRQVFNAISSYPEARSTAARLCSRDAWKTPKFGAIVEKELRTRKLRQSETGDVRPCSRRRPRSHRTRVSVLRERAMEQTIVAAREDVPRGVRKSARTHA